MKKTLLIILLLCFVLTSCEAFVFDNSEVSDGILSDDNSEVLDGVLSDDISEESVFVESEVLRIKDYDTYLDFINGGDFPVNYPFTREEDNVLPENFLDYKSISFLGEFDTFLVTSEARWGEYERYLYWLDVGSKNGEMLVLYVYNDKDYQPVFGGEEIPYRDGNLLQLDDNASGWMRVQDDVYYSYFEGGKLRRIAWWSNGVFCSLTDIHKCDSFKPELINALLDTRTAPAAIEKLKSLGN